MSHFFIQLKYLYSNIDMKIIIICILVFTFYIYSYTYERDYLDLNLFDKQFGLDRETECKNGFNLSF